MRGGHPAVLADSSKRGFHASAPSGRATSIPGVPRTSSERKAAQILTARTCIRNGAKGRSFMLDYKTDR